jgi:hypothetical protein
MRTVNLVLFAMAFVLLCGCTSSQNARARRQAPTIGPE